MAVRLEQPMADAERLATAIVACDGVAAVQIGITDRARTTVLTKEKGMRSNDALFAGLLIIEPLDESSLRNAWGRAGEIAPDVARAVGDPEIYRSIFALDARIADGMTAALIGAREGLKTLPCENPTRSAG